jgi:hypothetical protein
VPSIHLRAKQLKAESKLRGYFFFGLTEDVNLRLLGQLTKFRGSPNFVGNFFPVRI